MSTKKFWRDTIERVVSTAAQTTAGALLAGSIFTIDWRVLGGTVLGATLLAFAKALIASQTGAPESASLVRNVGDGRGW